MSKEGRKVSLQEIQHSLFEKVRKGNLTFKEIIDALQDFNLITEAIDDFYEELRGALRLLTNCRMFLM